MWRNVSVWGRDKGTMLQNAKEATMDHKGEEGFFSPSQYEQIASQADGGGKGCWSLGHKYTGIFTLPQRYHIRLE
jgi:hypothetical protein